MINTRVLYKNNIEYRNDFIKATEVFESLTDFMSAPEIQTELEKTHVLNAKSGEIQKIILKKTSELGFASEKKGLFDDIPVKQLRPDYYLKIDETSGVIMEVERGKTIANNMDILDLWKCHICKKANLLFLVVPNIRQTEKGHNKIFETVERRMETFFKPENYINVDGVFIIGY